MLSVKNIIKTFYDKKVLDNVSFNVQPGEIAVLLGRSGVGKSTVLRVLNNLETIDAGSIELNKKDIDFSQVGMLFQDFNLFAHLTVEENVILPLIKVASKSRRAAQKISTNLLAKFGLKDFAQSYPVSLSGGQKQRVALARTLAMNPAVLCLDEPTSALDPTLKTEIAHIIQDLAKQGFIIIITTHDTVLLQQLACTIHLMQHGKIIETATTKELQQSKNKYQKIKKFMDGK